VEVHLCVFESGVFAADVAGFQQYFSKFSIAVVGIQGRTFPVERMYLGEALTHSGYRCVPGAWYSRPVCDPTRN
jgi:hypothetical protein